MVPVLEDLNELRMSDRVLDSDCVGEVVEAEVSI